MESHEGCCVDEEKNLDREWKLFVCDDGAGPALGKGRVAVAVGNKGE